MGDVERTERGFRVYARIPSHGEGVVRVQESSILGEGAHVWLFFDGETCTDLPDRHHRPAPQLSVPQAKALRAALDEFIADAESGRLTEGA